MESHYIINVSQHGKFYFRIKHVVSFESLALILAGDVRNRFPESEGFKVEMTYYGASGKQFPLPAFICGVCGNTARDSSGKILFNCKGCTPVILPEKQKTRAIRASELQPDMVVIDNGRALKVGGVRHTDDGFTYFGVRTLTGEIFENNLCKLSAESLTVETR